MTISIMSLKIKGWRKIISWTFWSILTILFLVYFIRVATFEDAYYREKEGSERAETALIEEEVELIEEKPSETEIAEYIVAADMPRYLSVTKLGVSKARIIPVGINISGELGTPNNIFDAGWYDASAKPGTGGTMLLDGHNGGPHVHGIFKDLPTLTAGDIIEIERGDGIVFKYSVVKNITVALSDSDAEMTTAMHSPESGKESITIISCTGEWSQTQRTYLSRQFTYAVIVE